MSRHTVDGLKLSGRESQIAAGLALGLSDKELAAPNRNFNEHGPNALKTSVPRLGSS